ncbi:TPA: YjcQ family protein [Bacillus cereus]|uniref:YjcQ family protein n=1 Tax=Bacillus cereus TaxID=1396 RepID=UPI0013D836A2|nr:YjcQ family protein [Bacillus cereus]MDA2379492.1 YjcQ family protein [Bacillus cereus]
MNKNKLRYAILKEIESGNRSFRYSDLGVDQNIFDDQIRFLDREEMIIGVLYADNIVYDLNQVEITLKGENYLEQNSPWSKFYRGFKEIKGFIK